MRQRCVGSLGCALAVMLGCAPVAAADIERRSGTVVAVEGDAVVLEEIGPAVTRTGQAGNEVDRHRINLDASTLVVAVARSATGGPDGWPGGSAARPAGREAVREGTFVTVALRRADGRLTAEHVTVVAPEP